MKLSTRTSILLLLLIASFTSYSQLTYKRANKYYGKLAYVQAAELYQRFITEENDTAYGGVMREAKLKLVDCLNKTMNYDKAAHWYNDIITHGEVDAQHHFTYAQILCRLGRYEEAKPHYEAYKKEIPEDMRSDLKLYSISHLSEFKIDSGKYILNEFACNSKYTDFAPTYYKGDLLFASARGKEIGVKHKHSYNMESFLDIYRWKKGDTSVTKYDKMINTRFHEAGIAIDAQDTSAIFTRNSYSHFLATKGKDHKNHLKLYVASKEDDKWKKIKEFPFDSDEYNMGDPCLSPDGQILYFVSDMTGGFGGTDIYLSYWSEEDGGWTEPVNLGANVNTPGDERSPFIMGDGTFYFASDGREGLGGMDIYVGKSETKQHSVEDIDFSDASWGQFGLVPLNSKETEFTDVKNVGYPINSRFDDFYLIVEDDKNQGVFTSNRLGGSGGDDLYGFSMK